MSRSPDDSEQVNVRSGTLAVGLWRGLISAMDRVVTLTERKAAVIERKRQALDTLRPMLADYARAHGGRFLLFGSAARDELRVHSDVDILIDFPRPLTDDAWIFAEEACRTYGLTPDIRPRGWCSPSFLQHIEPEIEVLG